MDKKETNLFIHLASPFLFLDKNRRHGRKFDLSRLIFFDEKRGANLSIHLASNFLSLGLFASTRRHAMRWSMTWLSLQ
jgi:hypothetical protein